MERLNPEYAKVRKGRKKEERRLEANPVLMNWV
jgi:hypothetical protein